MVDLADLVRRLRVASTPGGNHKALGRKQKLIAEAAEALSLIGSDAARVALFTASAEESDEPLIHGVGGTAWIKFSTAERAIANLPRAILTK